MGHLACTRPHAKYCTWVMEFSPANRHLRERPSITISHLQVRNGGRGRLTCLLSCRVGIQTGCLPPSTGLCSELCQSLGVAHGCVLSTEHPSDGADRGAVRVPSGCLCTGCTRPAHALKRRPRRGVWDTWCLAYLPGRAGGTAPRCEKCSEQQTGC